MVKPKMNKVGIYFFTFQRKMILPGKVNITINDLNSFLLNKLQMVVTGAGAKTTAEK